ncbi:hypothetical protein [Flavobacterium quisquiliarum]|uniref:Uncharacterized protein n=1 Tax=Flavobacterium quisquiliarum TaxID=1834436 RepID=A0ABV8WDT4_9FLAO|nr:hypothetical protein [Flavobacterium quisquiliarum]MBW1656754.1 hypothetical protein [Flavobacterium quisquiliarum]
MTTTAILKDGTPVRIHLFEKPAFDVEGFLVGFTLSSLNSEEYRYYQHSEFKREDRKKPNLSGYYDKTMFLKYIQNVEPVPTLDKLVKYNFERVRATEGEEITVSTIDFGQPYDYFYNTKNYTFNLQSSPDKKRVGNYLKPIIENFEVIDEKVNLDGIAGVTVLNNQAGSPGGNFYKKNLGDLNINNREVSDAIKSNFKKVMSLIIFRIREIDRDIIPILASHTHFFEKEEKVADGIIDYNDNNSAQGFTDLEKLLFDLKRGWGYYYNPNTDIPLPLRNDFDAQFSIQSSFADYETYYSHLTSFYTKCNATKNLEYYPSDKKFQYLLEILPPSALSILPFSYIINAIKGLLTKKLKQDEQRFLVRLVLSITPSRANEFLDFLLEKENGTETNFQVIYDTLTDARLERYPFVNWFVDEQPNRKYFAFAIYKLWKVSKYNLDYIRPGIVVPDLWPNFKGIDPENYFYINHKEFNEKNWLTFIPSTTDNVVTTEQYFESRLIDKKVEITKITKLDHNFEHGGFHHEDKSIFGLFHLYQQVTFSGYKANLDLSIPTTATLPAFLFHFIKEYDDLADFDAGVALAINITADVLLIYFTGGANVLRDLQYLKYTTKIGRALQGSLNGVEAVEVWRGLEVGSEIFTVTTGELAHINQYLITTENDEQKRKILEKNQKVLLNLMLLGVTSSITARSNAVKEAEEALRLIDNLPVNTPHGIPPPMINVLTTLKGQKAVTLSLFGNKLNNLELGGVANTIVAKYNMLFTDAQRLKFWNDFQHIDDPVFWELLNSGRGADGLLNGSYINNWIDLSERGLQEAKFTDYICVQRRTDGLIRFTDQNNLKPIVQSLNFEKKVFFVDKYGSIENFNDFKFNKCIQQPKKLELLTESGNFLKRGQLDELLEEDILKIIESNLSNAHIDLLRIKNKNNLGQIVFNFEKDIANINLDLNRLRALRDGTAFSFMQDLNLTTKQIKDFQSANKLFVETKIYNNANLINTFNDIYISGWKNFVGSIFNNNIPNSIIEPGNNANFNIFKQKAIDIINKKKRYDDTELKYIFNFLEKHWDKGNRFEITMESTYYSCQSCQGYMLYLKQLAKQEGKVLNITIKSSTDAKDYKTLERL